MTYNKHCGEANEGKKKETWKTRYSTRIFERVKSGEEGRDGGVVYAIDIAYRFRGGRGGVGKKGGVVEPLAANKYCLNIT